MNELSRLLQKHRGEFHQVVNFSAITDKICRLDLSGNNSLLAQAGIKESQYLSNYIQTQLNQSGSKYGIGGYAENRAIYNVDHFSNGKEQRTLHLGIDIWGKVGTEVYVPIGGMVHSFAFNDFLGDYGATIIFSN